MKPRSAKYSLGQVVKHRFYPFRGVVFDVDPTFNNTEEWYNSIPENVRPSKDQPFYHLLAENAETEYIAYVSEQNLLPDTSGEPVRHPQVDEMFVRQTTATGPATASSIEPAGGQRFPLRQSALRPGRARFGSQEGPGLRPSVFPDARRRSRAR